MKKWICVLFISLSLSSFGQTGSEIILFDLKIKNGQLVLSNPVNITNHKGYDNQPFFHPSKQLIYYSSFDDSSRSDIKYYNYKSGKTSNLTVTRVKEYSPTVTPDGKFISCIIQQDNGAQDLGKYPIKGGQAKTLINNLTVGYHAWASKENLLLFVLGDSDRNTLHYYNVSKKTDSIIAVNIGRSLHKIPDQNAMSFIQKISHKESLIQRFDLVTGSISTIVAALPGQDHITWLQNNILISGSGDKLFAFKIDRDKKWQSISIEGGSSLLKTITRLATNTANTKLAVVVSE
jgi:WD40-like Beta Propeller Repeat